MPGSVRSKVLSHGWFLTVSLVVDEPLAGIELAASLAVDEELMLLVFAASYLLQGTYHVRAFDCRATCSGGDVSEGLLVREEIGVKSSDEPQFADGGF